MNYFKKAKNAQKCTFLGMGMFLISMILMMVTRGTLFVLLPIAMLIIVISAIVQAYYNKKYKESFKDELNDKYPNVKFFLKPDKDNCFNIIVESNLIPNIKNYTKTYEDMIVSKDENLPYVSFDLDYYYMTSDSNGGSDKHTLFEGRFYKIGINMAANVNIVIKRKGLPNYGTLCFEKMETESIAFNDKFQLFASDRQKALEILKPTTIEKITELLESVSSKFMISVTNDFVYFAAYDNGKHFDIRGRSENIFFDDYENQKNVVEMIAGLFKYVYKE